MGKRKAHSTAVEDLNRNSKKNKSLKLEDEKDKSKPIESIIEPENKKVKTKKNKKSQAIKRDEAKKNKKIIFNDVNDEPHEPIEVKNSTDNCRRTKQAELIQENEEDIKDEDIDKFCDALNEEDNEQYESWVKLIEAQLHSNKKKPN